MSERALTKLSQFHRIVIIVCAGLFVLFVLLPLAIGPVPSGIEMGESRIMQQVRGINLLLFSYSNDHNQQYLTGKSSTEIFQELLDEHYASDPGVFYLPLPGKTPPVDGQKLKPENVGFDVTSGLDSSCSDLLPVGFETGYKITYAPGGTATLLPPSGLSFPRTWKQWWNEEKPQSPTAGIAVAYKTNSALFLKLKPDAGGVVPNLISPDFRLDEKTYRQLTPEGTLP